jgi:hypothetical protein
MEPQQKRSAFILGVLLFVLAAIPGWQIAASYLANHELQGEMNDLAAQPAARVGLAPLASEDELPNSVVEKAKACGVLLAPEQVTAQLTTTPDTWTIYLAADYEAPVNMLVLSYPRHFAPASLCKWAIKRA